MSDISRPATRTFRIYERDLAILEKAIPVLHDVASDSPRYFKAEVQVAIEETKRILSDIRWDYGPYLEVICTPAKPPVEDDDA